MRSLFRVLLLTLAASLGVAAPASAVETGVNDTLNETVPLAATAGNLGADWVRIWGTWESAEPSPGGYDENYLYHLGEKVTAAKQRGIRVLVVIARSPGWAT